MYAAAYIVSAVDGKPSHFGELDAGRVFTHATNFRGKGTKGCNKRKGLTDEINWKENLHTYYLRSRVNLSTDIDMDMDTGKKRYLYLVLRACESRNRVLLCLPALVSFRQAVRPQLLPLIGQLA